MAQPEIVLVGCGVGDGLQLTVDAQRVLTHVGLVYGLGVRPRLASHLRSSGVQLIPLDDRLASAPPEESYLSIAEFVLRQAQLDPPAVLIVPGNPFLSNAICRFIAMRARELELRLHVLPAVSPIDTVVNATGLDVGTFGLQVFDARRFVSRRQRVDPSVPLILLQPASLQGASSAVEQDPAYEPLVHHLREFYPPSHVVTHLSDGSRDAGPAIASAPLDRFTELIPQIAPGSTLFVDLVRTTKASARTAPDR